MDETPEPNFDQAELARSLDDTLVPYETVTWRDLALALLKDRQRVGEELLRGVTW